MFSNVDGYKMIFFVENLLREYIVKHLPEISLPSNFSQEALLNAEKNNVNKELGYLELLEYLHLGQLYDLINSKVFREKKSNSISKVNILPLLRRRNTVMHSRFISADQTEEISDICEQLVKSFDDLAFVSRWEQFITREIGSYKVPRIFVEYPLGKDFDYLIGRDDELRELKKALAIPMPISIVRHGGLGKTALVLQLVEDLLYSPQRPFEQIFFMSFKNSVFENGRVRKFQKVISNHAELINKLAYYMNIDVQSLSFLDVEELVWKEVFSKNTLVVLDNLETEIVQTNLTEFTDIAFRFMSNFSHPSRLIITSRYGLGDREQKFPVYEFDLNRTKKLVETSMLDRKDKLRNVSNEDWKWLQTYTKGNPGLILSFCNSFRTTQKSLTDLRVEYNSKYTIESRVLHDMEDTFLEFCFENTVESLPNDSQVFLSALCYLSSEAELKEINEELFAFLLDELNFKKSVHDIRANLFVNIGFLQPIKGSDRYYVNEMFIDYINGNYADRSKVYTVFNLKSSELFSTVERIKSNIIDLLEDEDLSVGQLLSQLYIDKYNKTSDVNCLMKSYLCNPTINNLLFFYEKTDPANVINYFALLEKVKEKLLQKDTLQQQERLVKRIVWSLQSINNSIKTGDIRNIRQDDLYEYFNQLMRKVQILRTNNISGGLRESIVRLLTAINQLPAAESYLTGYEENLPRTAFELFSRQVGNWARRDREKCEYYIAKCNNILSKKAKYVRLEAKASYYVYLSRYYKDDMPQLAYKMASYLDEIPINSDTIFSLYLESLLTRADCIVAKKESRGEMRGLLEKYQTETRTPRYGKLRSKKRRNLEQSYNRLKRIESNLR